MSRRSDAGVFFLIVSIHDFILMKLLASDSGRIVNVHFEANVDCTVFAGSSDDAYFALVRVAQDVAQLCRRASQNRLVEVD
jgi:hypothetical protein